MVSKVICHNLDVLIITGQKNNIEKFIESKYKGNIKIDIKVVDCKSDIDSLIECS